MSVKWFRFFNITRNFLLFSILWKCNFRFSENVFLNQFTSFFFVLMIFHFNFHVIKCFTTCKKFVPIVHFLGVVFIFGWLFLNFWELIEREKFLRVSAKNLKKYLINTGVSNQRPMVVSDSEKNSMAQTKDKYIRRVFWYKFSNPFTLFKFVESISIGENWQKHTNMKTEMCKMCPCIGLTSVLTNTILLFKHSRKCAGIQKFV